MARVRLFNSLLEPSGMLIFTAHGAYAADRMRQREALPAQMFDRYDRTGFRLRWTSRG